LLGDPREHEVEVLVDAADGVDRGAPQGAGAYVEKTGGGDPLPPPTPSARERPSAQRHVISGPTWVGSMSSLKVLRNPYVRLASDPTTSSGSRCVRMTPASGLTPSSGRMPKRGGGVF